VEGMKEEQSSSWNTKDPPVVVIMGSLRECVIYYLFGMSIDFSYGKTQFLS
jgi:hypothetical protein